MEMRKIQCSDIHEGICFSEPVYFEDGKNMFLPAGKQVRLYPCHLFRDTLRTEHPFPHPFQDRFS